MPQVSEEVLRQIIQYLWNQHVANEQQWLYYILTAPIIALVFYLIMWLKHRAHCPSLLEAISFFFAPRGPERMLIFKDLAGNRFLVYGYNIVKGSNGYLIQAGPYMLKTSEDPESYAEPVSLLDARGPAGVPSPFGLWIRQMIASYIMLAIVAVGFANTFWITATVYAPNVQVGFTTVDLVSFAALVLALSWFITTLLRALAPQTLVISLSAIGASENFLEVSPALDVYSSFPPAKLLKSIGREVKIVVSDAVKGTLDKLTSELGDRSLAASILALLGQVYDSWRKSLGILLQDRYDISVAAKARYHLEEVKLPKGFLSRYAGVLALIAIILAIAVVVIWLQPSIAPATTATQTTTAAMPYTPATPPPPPHTHATTSLPTPAKPPTITTPKG